MTQCCVVSAGPEHPVSLPVLQQGPGGGSELAAGLVRLEGGVGERVVLPCFLGVLVGSDEAVLLRTAKRKERGASVLASRPRGWTTWEECLKWEAKMAREFSIDGGNNRDWNALLKLLPPSKLVGAVVAGLQAAGPDARADFVMLLDRYLSNYDVFVRIRTKQRLPASELAVLVQKADYGATDKGQALR
jgi:hypothetical protein